MELLGGRNLFAKDFVFGGMYCDINTTKTNTYEIEALHHWIDFKNSDYGKDKYRDDNLEYMAYLEIIDIHTLSSIINDLINIYKKNYPYSTKDDFLEHTLADSIHFIDKFLSIQPMQFTWIAEPQKEKKYTYYNFYQFNTKQFLIFGIDTNKEINHYIQYFKRVKQLIEDINFDDEQITVGNQIEKSDNLDLTLRVYETFISNCSVNYNDVSKIDQLSSELIEREIFNITHRSNEELKQYAKSGNHNFQTISLLYYNKFKAILKVHNNNVETHNLNSANNIISFRNYYDAIQPLFDLVDELSIILNKTNQEKPNREKRNNIIEFEDIFINTKNADICLNILKELEPPFIDANDNYIGKNKGIFSLWIKVLRNNEPQLIKNLTDIQYKDALLKRIKGLTLTNDASEFRKPYKRIENSNYKRDIKVILSQYSQEGKLGK